MEDDADTQRQILEELSAIRAKQEEHSQRFNRIEEDIKTFREFALAFLRLLNAQDEDTMKARLERIERRLELNEPEH